MGRSRRLGSVGEVSAPAEENRDLRLFLGKNVLGTDFGIKSRHNKGETVFGRFLKKHALMNILEHEFIDLE